MAGGMFSRLGNVSGPGGGGNFLNAGTYLIRVDKFVNADSQQGQGEFCALEFTVLEVEVALPASQGNAPAGSPPDYKASNRVGESVSAVWMAKHGDVSVANLKGWLAAMTGMDANDKSIPGERWQTAAQRAAAGDGTAFKGTILRVVATPAYTRAKKPITKLRFSGVDEATVKRFSTAA